MPKENDLQGQQDQGGKHGDQKGMPRPEPRPGASKDQGIVRDKRGREHTTVISIILVSLGPQFKCFLKLPRASKGRIGQVPYVSATEQY
jgi:hypothetical protein